MIENLQRRDVHPMEEAQGFKALLDLEEPKYSIEQIAAKTGKTPAYVATALEIDRACRPSWSKPSTARRSASAMRCLLAKLPADQQEASADRLLQRGLERNQRPQGQAHPAPRPQPPIVD